MTLWLLFAVLTMAALIPLLRPLMRGGERAPARADYDLAIYKDQLAELDRDQARGTLSQTEAAAARLEIQRRLLAAMPVAGADGAGLAETRRSMPMVAGCLLVLVPLAAIGLYAYLGQPDLPDAPLAARAAERPLLADDGNLDLHKVQAALRQRLAAMPDSLEGWVFLARTDGSLQDWAGARDAWGHARALSHDRADIVAGCGETLVAQAKGQVTPEAAGLFREAALADPKLATARYFLALAQAQHGDVTGAVAAWQALLREAPANASWRGQVEQMIAQAGQAAPAIPAAVPMAGPGAPPADQQAAIMSLPADQRSQAIQSMVDGLAARLQADPRDVQGWQRLARAYRVLGDPGKAADAYAHLAALDPRNPDPLVGQAAALRALHGDGGNSDAPVPADAQALYAKALVLDAKTPDALWFLGLAASQVHDATKAANYWRVLLAEIDPGSPSYAQVKQALDKLE